MDGRGVAAIPQRSQAQRALRRALGGRVVLCLSLYLSCARRFIAIGADEGRRPATFAAPRCTRWGPLDCVLVKQSFVLSLLFAYCAHRPHCTVVRPDRPGLAAIAVLAIPTRDDIVTSVRITFLFRWMECHRKCLRPLPCSETHDVPVGGLGIRAELWLSSLHPCGTTCV